jgi:lipoyl(octanoyl) transferase
VAAVGVAVRQWISFHGMAVNVRPDLDAFRDAVVPCGIPEAEGTVSSVSALAGTAIDMDEAAEALAACFFEVFPLERID